MIKLPNFLINVFLLIGLLKSASRQGPHIALGWYVSWVFLSVITSPSFVHQICDLEFSTFWIWQAIYSWCYLTCCSGLFLVARFRLDWIQVWIPTPSSQVVWCTSCRLPYTRRHITMSWHFSFCMFKLYMGLSVISLIPYIVKPLYFSYV